MIIKNLGRIRKDRPIELDLKKHVHDIDTMTSASLAIGHNVNEKDEQCGQAIVQESIQDHYRETHAYIFQGTRLALKVLACSCSSSMLAHWRVDQAMVSIMDFYAFLFVSTARKKEKKISTLRSTCSSSPF